MDTLDREGPQFPIPNLIKHEGKSGRDLQRQHLERALADHNLPEVLRLCRHTGLLRFEDRPLCPLARVCHTLGQWVPEALPRLLEVCSAEGMDPSQPPLGVLLQLPASPERDGALGILCQAGANLNREIDRCDLANTDSGGRWEPESCPAWLHGLWLTDRLPYRAFEQSTWQPAQWAKPTKSGSLAPIQPHPLVALCRLWRDDGLDSPLEGGEPNRERAHQALAWLLAQGLSWDDPWEKGTVLDWWRRRAPKSATPYALAHRMQQGLPTPLAPLAPRPRM